MVAAIGIKLADGEFYSILDEKIPAKKSLVLTTAHNNQKSVQIDLYKSNARTMVDAEYLGTLVINNIKTRKKGEASIEFEISSTKDGNITVSAFCADSSQKDRQILNISLASLGNSEDFDMPDFDLEDGSSGNSTEDLYERPKKTRPGKSPVFLIILILLLIILGLGIWYCFFYSGSGTELCGIAGFFNMIKESVLRLLPGR